MNSERLARDGEKRATGNFAMQLENPATAAYDVPGQSARIQMTYSPARQRAGRHRSDELRRSGIEQHQSTRRRA